MIVVNQSRALSPRIAYQAYVALVDLTEKLRSSYARRATRAALHRLSDQELADIGLSRSMIEAL